MDAKTVQSVIDVLGAKWIAEDNSITSSDISSNSMAYLGLQISPKSLEVERQLVAKTEPQMAALAPLHRVSTGEIMEVILLRA